MSKLLFVLLEWLQASLSKLFPKFALLLGQLAATLESAADDVVKSLVRHAEHAILRELSNDPYARAAIELMGRTLRQALADYYLLVLDALLLAMLLPLVFAGVPLVYKALTCRRQRIFVSYNQQLRAQESVEVQAALARTGALADRLPFLAHAQHNAVLQASLDGAKRADTLVCVPGTRKSFVDHEVAVAFADRKPVVFLISEQAGTLPETADMRYPMFKLERTAAAGYEPMVQFISYIGADLASTWSLCRRALAHPFMTLSARLALGGGGLLTLLLWGVCYVAVHRAGAAAVAKIQIPVELAVVAPLVEERLMLGHTLLLGVTALPVLWLGAFSALFVSNLLHQLRARAKARLQTTAACFVRDDWIGKVPGLSSGEPLYDCLFCTAPRPNHEEEQTT